MPSRASLFNALYPHSLNVYNNESRWGHSWIEDFQAAGYDTVSVGKMHTVPNDERCGFDQRMIVENKDHRRAPKNRTGIFDEWDKIPHRPSHHETVPSDLPGHLSRLRDGAGVRMVIG